MRIDSALACVLVLLASTTQPAVAEEIAAPPETLPVFAVQIRTGTAWDPAKEPQDQNFFREHSANLKRLRDAGHVVMGARYSDVGLIVLTAESETRARAMMDADPSFAAGTFRYEIHPMNVFYPGTVRNPAPPPVE